MKPLNYLRQATDELRSTWIPYYATVAPETSKICSEMLDSCKSAVKFVLPQGGRILKDKLKGLEGLDVIRLPFPEIVIEYACSKDSDGLVERLVGKDNSYSAPKRIVFAWENDGKIYVHSIFQGVSNSGSKVWTMLPAIGVVWPGKPSIQFDLDCETNPEEDIGFLSVSIIPAGELYDTAYGGGVGTIGHQRAYADITDEMNAVLELVEALSCSNVTHESLPIQKQNKSAAKRGALSFDEYRVLVVKVQGSNSRQSNGGTHGAPREHLRRGHIRILATGKRIWINSCVVNAGIGGRIDKSYDMRKAA